MILKDLIQFGLNEKEAKAYIALLELEVAGVNEIAKAAGIKRSSAYVTLESLAKRGLVSVSDDKSVRRYVATSPEALLRNAEEEAARSESMRKRIEAIVPEMRALSKSTKKKPLIKVFEGRQGLIAAFEDTLTSKEKLMRVCSSVENLFPLIPDYMPQYLRKRVEAGVRMQGIHPDNATFYQLTKLTPKGFDSPVPLPENKFKFPADIAIYDDKIGYMSHQDGGIAIIIQSKEIADVMKNMFDLAYQEGKRLAEKKSSQKPARKQKKTKK